MDRVNGNNTVDIGGGRRGFKSQNAAAGIPGTEVTDKILNDVQEEICSVIENSGFALDPENQQQLWEALQSIAAPGFANRTAWLPIISMTITAPPNDAVLGDAYVIPAGANGSWAGNQQKLAEWTGSRWRIVSTRDGHGVSLPDGRVFEKVGGAYIEKIALDVQSGKWSYGVTSGSANALTLSISPAPQAYVAGLIVRARISTTNTAAGPTLNVNGLGAKPIRYSNGRDVFAGELASGRDAFFYYDGSVFILANPMLYFEKLAPKAARRWSAFTPAIALSDISGVKSANNAQSIGSITGVTYLSVSAYCGIKNISTTFAGVIGYLVLRRSGQADQSSQYLGLYSNGSGSGASSIQQPLTLSAEFNNLDPIATYTLYLMVEKDLATGPIVVLDTYIRALSD
ncbi:DUF2793 domain-containing protein [Ochrobactrum pseudogrignonense]|uniref:DUF2793 domain-containing protein n=1 Tax=Brucella pseudogrignonensis TaxID=419475 RepID=A0A7Y3T7H9_9HYPH|nr:DUF2793 domain-containing protein [Brucella pseudogrignonensis]NNV20642.1 DUF2793 domain-containing protein [Brucella pseudogrignonensis]